MEEIKDFSIVDLEEEFPRSELVWKGTLPGLIVDGVWLEKQYKVTPGYLLLLTDDCPFEERLSIYLLSEDMRVLDSMELSLIYHMGILRDIKIESSNELTFTFFGEDCWRLGVRRSPRIGLKITNYLDYYTKKRHKKLGFAKRWLKLSRLKLTEVK